MRAVSLIVLLQADLLHFPFGSLCDKTATPVLANESVGVSHGLLGGDNVCSPGIHSIQILVLAIVGRGSSKVKDKGGKSGAKSGAKGRKQAEIYRNGRQPNG